MNISPYFSHAGEFLITLVFGLYILAVMLRFLLQLVRADFYNPVSQFLIRITNPVLRYFRRWIPGYKGIDWPSIVLMLCLQAIEICLVALLKTGEIPRLAGLFVLSAGHLLQMVVWIYIVTIIIQAVMSWINPGAYSPVTVLLYQLSDPLLHPFRRLVPPAGGMDWTPLIVLILLNLLLILFIAPLLDYGNILAGYRVRLL